METVEARAHSFILKTWCEEPADDGRSAVWRGRITHVPSGDCRYVQDLAAMVSFLTPYLEDLVAWRPSGRTSSE
jgi:hypothetical protein